MFTGFFYALREEGVPVSLTEWMTLMEALNQGLAGASLRGFYHLARAVLVKSEAYYDRFDLAFCRYFEGLETSPELAEKVAKWLEKALPPLPVDPRQRRPFVPWDLEEMRRALEERLDRQKEEHHGGSYWIGTGGTSPFGHSGYHPAGLRIGGESVNRSAVKVAAERRYRDFRTDETLSTRQFEIALRKLRALSQNVDAPKDELDVEATIDATCRNAGRLELIWGRPRKNVIKLILMMDSGGSMTPYSRLCGRLFNAASKVSHFKDIKFYYFHNCVYQTLFLDPFCRANASVPTGEVLRNAGSDYRLIIVGDASMAPSELLMVGGAIDWTAYNEEPGLTWLQRLAAHFPYAAWLNPVPKAYWPTTEGRDTISVIGQVFPMFELTVEGLEQAVKVLKTKR
ncbi:MAG: VWA domain-containing protein [Bacillota bacterium]